MRVSIPVREQPESIEQHVTAFVSSGQLMLAALKDNPEYVSHWKGEILESLMKVTEGLHNV